MTREELDGRLQALVDGSLEGAQLHELEEIMLKDESARLLYLDIVELESQLLQRETQPVAANVVPMDRILARERRRSVWVALIGAAAAVLVIGFIALQFAMPDVPLAELRVAPESEFQLTHLPGKGGKIPEGNTLEEGSRLQLQRGTVALTLSSGVSCIVRAPADLTLTREQFVTMAHGTAWFEVPQKASGFRVQTPEFLLTDLGTEFGIISRLAEEDVVHVMTGEVEVLALSGEEEKVSLVAGQARRINVTGSWDEIEFDEEPFLESLPNSPALPTHLYWSFNDAAVVAGGSNRDAGKLKSVPLEDNDGVSFQNGVHESALTFQKGGKLDTGWQGIPRDLPRTVAFWIRIPEVGFPDSQVLGWGDWSDPLSNSQWCIRLTNARYNAVGPGKPQKVSTPETRPMLVMGHCWFLAEEPIEANRWCHIAAVYSGAEDDEGRPEIDLYLNGKAVPSSYNHWGASPVEVNTDIYSFNSSPLILGKPEGSSLPSNFVGEIDELYIFNAPLSEAEIYALAYPNGNKES